MLLVISTRPKQIIIQLFKNFMNTWLKEEFAPLLP